MKLLSKRNMRGFSLVELMVVVSIIGILASLAMPKFKRFQAKAKQSEAKSSLSHIFALETGYYGDKNTYGDAALVGWTDPSGGKYACTIVPTQTTFVATCNAPANTICAIADTWTMNENKTLATTSDCSLN